jgi:hypothetical protein
MENKHQDIKCFFGAHKYEIYKEEEMKNFRNEIIGKVVINRCSNCGRIKVKRVYTTIDNGR